MFKVIWDFITISPMIFSSFRISRTLGSWYTRISILFSRLVIYHDIRFNIDDSITDFGEFFFCFSDKERRSTISLLGIGESPSRCYIHHNEDRDLIEKKNVTTNMITNNILVYFTVATSGKHEQNVLVSDEFRTLRIPIL
jgi:hypothetical protein